jgi:hypothetical protein
MKTITVLFVMMALASIANAQSVTSTNNHDVTCVGSACSTKLDDGRVITADATGVHTYGNPCFIGSTCNDSKAWKVTKKNCKELRRVNANFLTPTSVKDWTGEQGDELRACVAKGF